MSNRTLVYLGNLGIREIEEAANLMQAYACGKTPKWFYDNGVAVEFNPNSDKVFLTNGGCQCLMFDDSGELKGWHCLGYYGYEGFISDLWEEFLIGNIQQEDWEELAYHLELEGMTREAQYVRTARIAEAIKKLPEKLPCQYSAGESRLHPFEPCDYILVDVSPLQDELDGKTELYAELPPDSEDETATYQPLKEVICDQLDEYGLPHDIVNWPYQD